MHPCVTGTLAALLALGFAAAAPAASVVKIQNRSSWDLHELYLSPVDDADWGPDQLGEHIVESGASFSLRDVPCDAYDVQLVDEDGDACVVGGVALCSDDVWVIDDEDLLACQAATD